MTIVLMPLSGILTGRVHATALSWSSWRSPERHIRHVVRGAFVACRRVSGTLSFARMMQAMWLPFLFIPISSASLVGIPPSLNGDASAMINLMRNLGGSIGISYTTTLLAYRQQFHQSRLMEHITAV